MRSLVAVLANPPLGTSGSRTLARVELAAELLGVDGWSVVNLLDAPTLDVRGISEAGAVESSWLRSRASLDDALSPEAVVLAAWGVSSPTGAARRHQRQQVEWVQSMCVERGLEVLAVGEQPRHPSRWQRFTSKTYPNVAFRAALNLSIGRYPVGGSLSHAVSAKVDP